MTYVAVNEQSKPSKPEEPNKMQFLKKLFMKLYRFDIESYSRDEEKNRRKVENQRRVQSDIDFDCRNSFMKFENSNTLKGTKL